MRLCFQALSLWFFENKHICSKGSTLRAYKCRLAPSPALAERLRETSCRLVYSRNHLHESRDVVQHPAREVGPGWGVGASSWGDAAVHRVCGEKVEQPLNSPGLCPRFAVWPWVSHQPSLNLLLHVHWRNLPATHTSQKPCEGLMMHRKASGDSWWA